MAISKSAYSDPGARVYTPEGPFSSLINNQGVYPSPTYAAGTVIDGDDEAEFVALIFAPVASVTLNQGDFLVWDQSYVAIQSATGTGAHPFGAAVGALFLGGRVGDPAAAPNAGNQWSFTFSPGIYLVWAQRAGTQVLNIAAGGTQTKPAGTTAVAGQLAQPATALVGSMGVQNVWSAPTSTTFTATTLNGSAILTSVSSNKSLARGQALSGTGIPAGAYIVDISGATVTMSAAATASGSAITVTSANAATTGNVANGSTAITGVAAIPGIYPNQTIAGTGIPASATITSISGIPGAYTINISAAATATNAAVALTTTGYQEGFLRWPNVNSQN